MRSIKGVDFDILCAKEFWPSSVTWEDEVQYFLMLDRFSNGKERNETLYNLETDFN